MTIPDFSARQAAYLPFLVAALLFSLLGGLTLAVALPLEAALRQPVGAGWFSHAQVHGHLQSVGFAGLFIVGVSYFLLPRFARRPLAYPGLVVPTLVLLVAGVLLRTLGQPAADHAPFAVLLTAGAWLEVAGAACYAASVLGTAGAAARRGEAFALMFIAGSAWLLVQAVVGAVWLTELAADGGTTLLATRSATLVALQVFGFQLSFIGGVMLHVFPAFFAARPPSVRAVLPPIVLIQGGVALVAAARLAAGGGGAWLAQDAGQVALGAGLLWVVVLTGWWRGPAHMNPAAGRFASILWPATAWLVVAAALNVLFAARALLSAEPPPAIARDAVLHIVTIGVVLMLIVGMAQLMLPEFAAIRIGGRAERWRTRGFGVALSAAVVLRAGGSYFRDDLPGTSAYWAMALAGLLGLLVALAFAVLMMRGARQHRRLLARIQAGLPVIPRDPGAA